MMIHRHLHWAWGLLLCASSPLVLAADVQALHRKLDRLQALGVGMLHQHVPTPLAPAEAASTPDESAPRTMSREDLEQRTQADNARSAARLTEFMNKVQADCGSRLRRLPELGMSDEDFRNCTMHARFGKVYQLVVSEDAGIALRLYVFRSEQAHKVYSVGGVVTAIVP
jgi:integrase